jgi:hypothetical protein
MAHECPDCGLSCHCNGDIDDCLLNDEEDVIACRHCPPERELEDEYDDPFEDMMSQLDPL